MIRKVFLILSASALVAALSFAQTEPAAPATAANLFAPLTSGGAVELPAVDPRVPRPDAFFGYPLGARFTHWDRMVAYLEALDAASPRVSMIEYGRTYEGRPLQLVAITSPQNQERLEEIRQEHQRLADPDSLAEPERDRLVRRTPLVLWLAYGIHGNESSSAEAAMATAYTLAAAQGETAAALDNLVVLIDPLSNPDGRERYVSSFEQRRGQEPNPRISAAEHWEPWPGGRTNHYAVDMNRDWAWASQQETRHRIAAYRSWEPQVYVDFHEMSSSSSYFFPPSADPVHPQIDRRIVGWLDVFGRNNAQAFDRQGWIYFKGERYDLFYPGYGDSYPSLRGAVGMTYEMAGGGRGGLAITLPDGSVLSLADRVARHFTTSMATFHTAAANHRKLLEDYVANIRKPAAEAVRSYVWTAGQPESRTLADLLAFHGIRVRQLGRETELRVKPLRREGQETARRFPAGSYVVSTAQPLGNLVEALLELESPMTEGFLKRQRQRFEQSLDTEFYDITAWSLPLAFNLDTWVAAGEPAGLRPVAADRGGIRGEGSLGYLIPPQGVASYRLAAELQTRQIRHRVAMAPFTAAGTEYPSGTIFVPRQGNAEGLRETLAALLAEGDLSAQGVISSYEVEGLSLGSSDMVAVRPVRVGLVGGDGVDALSFGFLWHLLDMQIGVPHDRLDIAHLDDANLADFNVLVLPSGGYKRIAKDTQTALDSWVKNGGVLVGIGDAVEWLRDVKLTSIKAWEAPAAEQEEPAEASPDDPEAPSAIETDIARRTISTPGAIVATQIRKQHPLTLGIPSPPPVLVDGSLVLLSTGNPLEDVLLAADQNPVIAGFTWPEAEERLAGSLLVGMESHGNGGVVVFAQEPTFRLFWRGTMPLFLNAVLYGPSTGVGGNF